MIIGLILFPVLMAAVAFAIPWSRIRVWLLPITGIVHLTLAVATWWRPDLAIGADWLVLDALGRLVLLLISVVFMVCSMYAVGYLRYRRGRTNRIFCGCMLMMLAMMSLVTWSHHFGLMWVAIEATTLSAAPLIYFNRTARSIEATWKYLLVGSVGIALALLGSFFLAYSSLHADLPSSLTLEDLIRQAPHLSTPWLHAAFVLLLVGYGTKMGLAPMHTWKPDAYGEAPGLVGAMLAGGVTSCAFLAILRVYQVCAAAGEAAYAGRMFVFMGLLSMAVAGVFMVGQRDFKRMLAYSSVEHMGILVLGIGIGGVATYGALLHMINNGLAKGVMFLSAGNIHRAYESKLTDDVRGAMRRLPVSGSLFLIGFIAVTGSPPFAPFISEFMILNGAIGTDRYFVSALFLLFLLIVFIGMGATVLTVVQGRPSPQARASVYRDSFLTAAPVLIFMSGVLVLGLYLPEPLRATLKEAAALLEVRP
jgi:hydrogenase-4 component F